MRIVHPLIIAILSGLLGRGWCASSRKRGLVYVASADNANDDPLWIQEGSELTWYYTYHSRPARLLADSSLEFVPMLWGSSRNPFEDTTFLDDVRDQLAHGVPIKHVLAFNEPNGDPKYGGSQILPDMAAAIWKKQMEPLKEDGVKLGLPAVTNAPSGFVWLEEFFQHCDGKCNPDFIAVHWYGNNFEGLAGHLGHVRGIYPNLPIWLTEYGLAHHPLQQTQALFQASLEYLDKLE